MYPSGTRAVRGGAVRWLVSLFVRSPLNRRSSTPDLVTVWMAVAKSGVPQPEATLETRQRLPSDCSQHPFYWPDETQDSEPWDRVSLPNGTEQPDHTRPRSVTRPITWHHTSTLPRIRVRASRGTDPEPDLEHPL